MPEPRDPAPGNEDLSAFGGSGALVIVNEEGRGPGIDQRPGANSETATPRSSTPQTPQGLNLQENRSSPAGTQTASSASSQGASPTGGAGPVDNFMNKVTLGTYKFTFYIVDSDVHNDARQWLGVSDEPALSAGKACIVAESGVEGAFLIENVVILTEGSNPGNGNADVRQITFEILEPLGFSLMDKLLTVGKELHRTTGGNNVPMPELLYVLKLEFLGRDPLTGATKKYEENFLYRGMINAITGTLGAAGARYFIEYSPEEKTAQQEGQIQADVTVRDVTTVRTFVSNLQTALNQHEESIMVQQQDKPLREWVIRLGNRSNVQARDHLRIPAFDLSSAPWAGSADTSSTAGQAEMLSSLGGRQVTLTGESGIVTHIQQQIANNTPTFAEWLIRAREGGITEGISVIQNVEDLDEIDPHFNVARQRITITINLRADATIPPLNPNSIQGLRNSRITQEERFDNEIFPFLVKKYTYLYTGENTEVIDINLELDYLFSNAQSPAAGIYYANNHNQFEPNIIPIENPGRGGGGADAGQAANPPAQSHASARYLSDVQLNKYNILQSTVFSTAQRGPQTQQRNETTTTDTIAAAAIEEYSRRIGDTQTLTIQVRGDPIFLGQTGSGNNIFDGSASAIYAAFLNYQPDSEDLLVNQRRGPIDMVTTGIYKITSIENKFQMGSFTQTITMLRDSNTTTFYVLEKIIELELR